MQMKILAISGSLRKASLNTGLLRACIKHAPSGVHMDLFVPHLPLFSQDLETAPLPQEVLDFRKKAKEADAYLIGCPEYNFGMTAALKNAIDWASRGEYGNCFADKPAALVGAGGGLGTLCSQMHFRDIAYGLNIYVMNQPFLMVKAFQEPKPFDMATGELIDPAVDKQAAAMVEGLVQFTKRMKK